MTAQCFDPFSVSRSARMDGQEDSLRTRETSSDAVAADITMNETTFSPPTKPRPTEESKGTEANEKLQTNKKFSSKGEGECHEHDL